MCVNLSFTTHKQKSFHIFLLTDYLSFNIWREQCLSTFLCGKTMIWSKLIYETLYDMIIQISDLVNLISPHVNRFCWFVCYHVLILPSTMALNSVWPIVIPWENRAESDFFGLNPPQWTKKNFFWCLKFLAPGNPLFGAPVAKKNRFFHFSPLKNS